MKSFIELIALIGITTGLLPIALKILCKAYPILWIIPVTIIILGIKKILMEGEI